MCHEKIRYKNYLKNILKVSLKKDLFMTLSHICATLLASFMTLFHQQINKVSLNIYFWNVSLSNFLRRY